MKYYFILILLLVNTLSVAQTEDISKKVEAFEYKIETSKKGEKLRWKDSLLVTIKYNEQFEYEKKLEESITFALAIDSIKAFTRLTSDLVFYKTHRLQKPEESIALLEQFNTREIEKTQLDLFYLGTIYSHVSDAHYSLQQYDQAILLLNKAKENFLEIGDEKNVGEVYRRIGNSKSVKGDFTGATKDIQTAISIFEKINDTINIITTKESMAILYSQSNFFDEAVKERKELLAYYPSYSPEYTPTYLNAAINFKDSDRFSDYLSNLKLAENTLVNNQFDYYYGPLINAFMADAYALNDSLTKAKKKIALFEDAHGVWNPDSKVSYNLYLDAKTNLLLKQHRFNEALSVIKIKLDLIENKQSFTEQYKTYKTLADIYGGLGDKNTQNKHLVTYYKIKDSITNSQNIKSLAYYQTLYETEKRDNTIKAQKTDLALLEQKNKTRNQWFLFLGILTALGVTGFILYKNYKQKLQRRLAVEQLRTKISADLHDDVGSLLTGLSMQTELLSKQVPEAQKFKLERVSQISKDAMLKMRDAVWAMDARKDNWQSLTDRMNEFATENLELKDIAYTLDIDNIELSKAMQGAVRQNLYLIFKEAIANVLKHSNATKVTVTLSKTKNMFQLEIADNGSIEKKQSPAGQGLTNMTLRATQLFGNLHYKNDDGFQITVSIPSS